MCAPIAPCVRNVVSGVDPLPCAGIVEDPTQNYIVGQLPYFLTFQTVFFMPGLSCISSELAPASGPALSKRSTVVQMFGSGF